MGAAYNRYARAAAVRHLAARCLVPEPELSLEQQILRAISEETLVAESRWEGDRYVGAAETYELRRRASVLRAYLALKLAARADVSWRRMWLRLAREALKAARQHRRAAERSR